MFALAAHRSTLYLFDNPNIPTHVKPQSTHSHPMVEPLSTITMQLNKHHRKDIGQLQKFKPGTSTRESPHTNFNRSTKTSTITINDVHRCRVFALLSSVFPLLIQEEALVIIPGMHPSDTCEQRKASHCRQQSKMMRREETCGTNPHAYLCKYSWWHDSLTDSQRPLAANAAGCLPLPSYSESDSHSCRKRTPRFTNKHPWQSGTGSSTHSTWLDRQALAFAFETTWGTWCRSRTRPGSSMPPAQEEVSSPCEAKLCRWG